LSEVFICRQIYYTAENCPQSKPEFILVGHLALLKHKLKVVVVVVIGIRVMAMAAVLIAADAFVVAVIILH